MSSLYFCIDVYLGIRLQVSLKQVLSGFDICGVYNKLHFPILYNPYDERYFSLHDNYLRVELLTVFIIRFILFGLCFLMYGLLR